MPDYRQTTSFKNDYKDLSEDLKTAAKEAFKLFQHDPVHPFLDIHTLGGHRRIWAGHITGKYVFTFEKEKTGSGDTIYWFRRIGDHTIYKNP